MHYDSSCALMRGCCFAVPLLHKGTRTLPELERLQTPALGEVLDARGSEDDTAQSEAENENAQFQSHIKHLLSAVQLLQPLDEPVSSAGGCRLSAQLAGRQGVASQLMHDADGSPVLEHQGVTMQLHAYPQNALCRLCSMPEKIAGLGACCCNPCMVNAMPVF